MRRLLREVDDFCLELPGMYKEHFHKILPLHKIASLLREHQLLCTPARCSDTPSINVFPSFSRFASLTSSDYDNLKAIVLVTIKWYRPSKYLKLTLFSQHFDWFRNPGTKNSAYVMAL